MTHMMVEVHRWLSRLKAWKREMIEHNDSISFDYTVTLGMISVVRHNPFHKSFEDLQAWTFGPQMHKLKLPRSFIEEHGLDIQLAFASCAVESWDLCVISEDD